jgi:hypothetical protein
VSRLASEAQALIHAGRGALRPSSADRARILEALHTRIAAPSGPSASGPSVPVPAAAASGFGWPGIALIAVGLGVGGGLVFQAFGGDGADAPVVAAVVSTPAVTAPAPLAPAAPPATVESVVAPAPAATEARAVSRRPSDRLAEEVEILSRAEKELHAGRFAAALRLLDEHATKFPRGAMKQERVAARIHALCGAGRVSEANAELTRLSPGSLHEESAREACATGPKK